MYRLPFHLISGQGLGYLYSSLSQIGAVLPPTSVGQAQINVYVNTNGNVVVEDPICSVMEGDHALPLQWVYNSQVKRPQAVWRFAVEKRLRQIENGAAVVVLETCGHETVYRERRTWFAGQNDEQGHLLRDEASGTFEWRLPGASEGLRFDATGQWQSPANASVKQAYATWAGASVRHEGEQVVLQRADGVLHTFTRRGHWYMAPSHAAGTARVYYDEGCADMPWVWVDPASGVLERYDTKGLRVQWCDREGRGWRLAQESQAGEASWVLTGDSGRRYVWQRQADADESSLRCYSLSEKGTDEHSQVLRQYYFDEEGLLKRSVFTDGYTVTYHYDGNQARLLSKIEQSDGTRLALDYQLRSNGRRWVTQVILGEMAGERPEAVRWFVNYQGDDKIEVTDNHWRCRLQLDGRRNVTAVTQDVGFDDDDQGVEETTHYQYTTPAYGAGQIERIQYANGGVECFKYDAFSGLVTCHTGADGQEKHTFYRVWGTRAETLVSEVRKVDDQSLVTQYVYDYDYRQAFTFLRFVLSPQGRVTEYESRDNGHEVIERVYLSQAYPHHDTPPGFPPLLAQLTAWVSTQRQAGHPVSVQVQRFDERFQLRDTLAYAEVDAKCGTGLVSEGMQATRTMRGRAGEVRDRWQLLGYQPDDSATPEMKSARLSAASPGDRFVRIPPVGKRSIMDDWAVVGDASREEDFVWVSDEDETVSGTPQALRPEPLPAPGRYAHVQWTYDGLQRERSHCDALGACTQYTYEDAKQAFTVRYPNAREARHAWDSKGLEVSETHTVGGQSLPQTRDWRHRFRPLTGEKVETVGPEGYPVYTFYDGMGREVLTIEVSAWSKAQVTRTLRDTAHRWTQTLAFAKPLDLSRYQERFERGMFPGTDVMLMEIDAQGLGADLQDQRRYQVLDRSDRLRYDVVDGADPKQAGETPAWYVTEQVYDALDRPVRTIAYAEPLSEREHSALLAGDDLSRVADPQVDRVEQTFYTAEGLVLAEQDAAGYVTRYAHDVGGRVWRTTHYATPSAHTRDLASLFPKPHPDDAYHYVYYDALSRPVLEVDAEGFVTTLTYQADQLHERRRFANRVSDAWWRLSEPRPRPDTAADDGLSYMPAPSAADECITYTYDEKGRLIEERHNDGTLKVNTYDAMDQLIEQVVQDTQHPLSNDGDHRRAQGWRFDGWGQVTHYANAYVSQAQQAVLDDETLSEAEKAARLTELWETRAERRFYTPSGLLMRVEQRVEVAPDQWGERKTLTYYDRRFRPAVRISAGGAVVRYDYHPLHEAPAKVYRYARALPPEALAPLLGGDLADLPKELLADLTDPARDRQEVFDFDRRGLQVCHLDGEGHAWRTALNAFGEDVAQEEPAVQAGQPIHITQERDVRGLVRRHTRAAGDLQLSTHSHHAHRLGLVTESKDALGASTVHTYDRLGRLHTVRAAGQSRASVRTYDAWGRVLRVEDALGQVTGHTYARQMRAHTIHHPQEGTWTRMDKNIFAEGVLTCDALSCRKRREHAPDGQVRLEEDGEGNLLRRVFNDLGWLLSEMDAEGIETHWQYDVSGFVVTQIEDVHGRALHTHYRRDAFGQMIRKINPADVVTDYRYNRQGYEVSRVLDPAAVYEKLEDEKGEEIPGTIIERQTKDLTAATLAVNEEPLGLLKQTQVNAHGAQTGLIQGDEATPIQYREAYVSDALNRPVAKIVDPQTEDNPLGLALTTKRLLDAKDRVVAHFDAKGQVRYDVFDARDNLVYKIDASGAVTERVFDDVDQCRYQRVYHQRLLIAQLPCPPSIEQVRQVLSPSAQDKQTLYYQNGNGQLRFVLQVSEVMLHLLADEASPWTVVGGLTEYMYDKAGRRTGQRQYANFWQDLPADVREWSLAAIEAQARTLRDEQQDRCQYWVYDAADRECFHFDSDGAVHRSDYDGKGRLITQRRYAKAVVNAAQWASYSPEVLRKDVPKSAQDQVTQFFYDVRDKQSRADDGTSAIFDKPTCTIAPNGLVHEFIYTPTGALLENRQYAEAVNPRHRRQTLLATLRGVRQSRTDRRVNQNERDKADRKIGAVDAQGFKETFVRDALDTLRRHEDRMGGVTTFEVDGAKRVVDEYQPQIITYVTEKTADNRLTLKELGPVRLHIHTTFDANGNVKSMCHKDDHTPPRVIDHEYDANNRAMIQRVKDIPIDDPTQPAGFERRPVRLVTQETGSRTDGFARMISEQQPNGHWQFNIYDGLDRKVYALATDGAVIGYCYNAFGNVVEKVEYINPVVMSAEELAVFKETGVPYTWLQAHLRLDPQNDRRSFYERDAKGHIKTLYKPFLPVYEPRTRKLFEQEQPVVFHTFDVFGHCVAKRAPLFPRMSNGPSRLTHTWYNHEGKPLCEITSVQLSVDAPITYRAKRFEYNVFGNLVHSHEYDQTLDELPPWSWSIAQVDERLATLASPQDKRRRYPHDARGLLSSRVEEQVVRQQVTHSDDPAVLQPPSMADLPPQDIAERYSYTAMEQRSRCVGADDSDTYRYYNARGAVIADIEARRWVEDAQGQGAWRRPATLYYVDSFGQRLGERKLARGAPVEVDEYQLPELELSEKDEWTLFMLDERGRVAWSQSADGALTGYTHTLGSQPAREWVMTKGYKQEAGVSQPKKYLDERRFHHDRRDRAVSVVQLRGGEVVRAKHHHFDALGDSVAQTHNAMDHVPEHPETWPIQRRYVGGDHTLWSETDDKGVPHVYLSDACGEQTANLTSAERDLSQVTLAQLSGVLKDPRVELDAKVNGPQGVVLKTNHTYIDPLPTDKVERIAADFAVSTVDASGSVWVSWAKQPFELLTTRFSMWREGETPQEYPVIEVTAKREEVEIAEATTDRYCVKLQYFRVRGDGSLADTAEYHVTGEVALIGQHDTNARHLVVQPDGPSQLRLRGRTAGLTSVVLYRDETPVGEYKVGDDRQLDLSAQASGVYRLAPRYAGAREQEEPQSLPFTVYTTTPSASPLSRQFSPEASLQVVYLGDDDVTVGERMFGCFDIWDSLPPDHRQDPVTLTVYYDSRDVGTGLLEVSQVIQPGVYLENYPGMTILDMPRANLSLPANLGVLHSVSVVLHRGGNETGGGDPVLLYEMEPVVGQSRWADPTAAALSLSIQDWDCVSSPPVNTYRFAARQVIVIEPLTWSEENKFRFFDKSRGVAADWLVLEPGSLHCTGRGLSFDLSKQMSGVYPYTWNLDPSSQWQTLVQADTFKVSPRDTQAVFASDPAQPIAPKPMQASQRYGWNVRGEQVWHSTATGARTDYRRNDAGHLVQVTGPEMALYENGRPRQSRPIERIGYGLMGSEIGRTDGNGNTTVLLYDAAGQKLAKILGDGTWSYQQAYDLWGQVILYLDSAGNGWRTRYEGGYPVELKDSKNQRTLREYTVGHRLIRQENVRRQSSDRCEGLITTYAHDVDGMVSERALSSEWMPKDRSWTRTRYGVHGLPVYREHSVGRSMTWTRNDYGVVDWSVDFGGNRLNFTRDFKGQVTNIEGPHSQTNRLTWKLFRTWLPWVGYTYDLGVAVLKDKCHLQCTYSGGQLIRVEDKSTGWVTSYSHNENGTRKGMEVRHDGVVIRSGRIVLDALERLVEAHDRGASAYYTGYDAAEHRVFVRAIVGQSEDTRHTKIDAAGRAVIDQGVLENGEIVLGPDKGVALVFEKGQRRKETRRIGNQWLTQTLTQDKLGRVSLTKGSVKTSREYTRDGYLRVVQEGDPQDRYWLQQVWEHTPSGTVYHQQTARENNQFVSRTDFLNFDAMGHPYYQFTELHTDDHLKYELYFKYLWHGEEALLLESSGRTTNDYGSRPTTLAQNWYDENFRLQAQTGLGVNMNSTYRHLWLGLSVRYVSEGLNQAAYRLLSLNEPEVVLWCQFRLPERGDAWYACYVQDDGLFGFARLTAHDAGYAVLRALGDSPSSMKMLAEPRWEDVWPVWQAQGVRELNDMWGVPCEVSRLAGLSSASAQADFHRWWQSWLTGYAAAHQQTNNTQRHYYEQDANGALLSKTTLRSIRTPEESVKRQMFFWSPNGDLLSSVDVWSPDGGADKGRLSLMSRYREAAGGGRELMARHSGALPGGLPLSKSVDFVQKVHLSTQERSAIRYPRPISDEDLQRLGERGMPQVMSDLGEGDAKHTVLEGETLSQIALRHYGDAEYASFLAIVSGLDASSGALPQGLVLTIPAIDSLSRPAAYPGYAQVLALVQSSLIPHLEAAQPPPSRNKRKCKQMVAQLVTSVIPAVVVLFLQPGAGFVVALRILSSMATAAALNGGLQVAMGQLKLLDKFSWENLIMTAISAGTGTYLQTQAGIISRLEFWDAAKHLAVVHGTANAVGQLSLMATGHQSSFNARALVSSVAASVLSNGIGSHLEVLKNQELQMLVQEQVSQVTASVIRGDRVSLESMGLNLLSVGLSLATQLTLQAMQKAFSPVESDTRLQESRKNEPKGHRYVMVEDEDYHAGTLAGQGQALGGEHAWHQGNEWTSRDELQGSKWFYPEGSAWAKNMADRVANQAQSRYGVQSTDRVLLEAFGAGDEKPLVSPGDGQARTMMNMLNKKAYSAAVSLDAGAGVILDFLGRRQVDEFIGFMDRLVPVVSDEQARRMMSMFNKKAYSAAVSLDAGAGVILDFLGRRQVDEFIGFMDRHHVDIVSVLQMIMAAPVAVPAAVVPQVARGTASVSYSIWDTVGGPQAILAGKLMFEKVSLGIKTGVSAARSRFGFFAGRKGAPVASTGRITGVKNPAQRYPKQQAQYSSYSERQLNKAIASHEKQIARHQAYIQNPKSHVPNWSSLSATHQKNLLHHWKADITRHKNYSEIARDILKRQHNNTGKMTNGK
jgi:YD repeat-containing protein